MEEEMIDGGFQAQGDAVPLASPTGKLLEVYASKTRAQALSLTGANPQALFFPTDADSIVFNGKEYGASKATGLKYVNGIDAGYMPSRIDLCAECDSAAGSNTKEITLMTKNGKSWARNTQPIVLVVKFKNGNTYQGRTVNLSINGGEHQARMGESRSFPYLPPGASLILANYTGSQWEIVGNSAGRYEIGDVLLLSKAPTTEELDELFGTHDGMKTHPLLLAIKGGSVIMSNGAMGKIPVMCTAYDYYLNVTCVAGSGVRVITATNTSTGWQNVTVEDYSLSKLK